MEHQTKIIDLVGGSKLLVINLPVAVSFSFDIYVRSGYRFVPTQQYELPHLLEHLAFEGNRKYPDPIAFKSEVEKDGAYFNAWTNSNYNQYEFVSIPQELTRIIKLGLAQVFEPILAPKSIKHEKEVITNELTRNNENFARQRWYQLEQLIVGTRVMPSLIKRIECLKAITPDQLRQYHQSTYHPQNIYFVLSGQFSDQNIADATALINATLQEISVSPPNQYKPYAIKTRPQQLVTKPIPVKDQTLFMLKFLLPGCLGDELAPLSILTTIYTGGFSSRMMIKGRQKGLTYEIGSGVSALVDYTCLTIWDHTRPENLVALFKLAISQLMELKAGNYSEAELERARGFEIGGFRRHYQTPVQYADWYGEDFVFERQLISPEQRIEELASVSRKDIHQAADRFITPDTWAMSLLAKRPNDYATELATILESALKR